MVVFVRLTLSMGIALEEGFRKLRRVMPRRERKGR